MAEFWDVISVSAGQRGVQIFMAPADYMRPITVAYLST